MALNISDEYPYAVAPTADYPAGSFKNDSTGATGDGTPVDNKWANDIFGFLQGLLSTAGIVASGAPDTAVASQYRDAMEAIMWTPGDYKWCSYSTPGRRWLECNGGSIGSAASGATARANADTVQLFAKLWGEAAYVIQTSTGAPSVRGASAAADFAADKRIVLPDWRSDTLRAWDHGRGVDAGRAIGTEQLDALQNITGDFGIDDRTGNSAPTGAFATGGVVDTGSEGAGAGVKITFDASRVVRTSTETRMRNGSAMLVIRF